MDACTADGEGRGIVDRQKGDSESSTKGSDSLAARAHFTRTLHGYTSCVHVCHTTTRALLSLLRIAIIGTGKLGTALAHALSASGVEVLGPFGRAGLPPERDAVSPLPLDVVLLAVPERALADVARTIPRGPLVGHCSASASLALLEPHERFNMHPLMTLNRAGARPPHALFPGAACAIDGNTTTAREMATALATRLGMRAVLVPPERRALYHAAASVAANYLVTLEHAAETLGAAAGITRAELAPLAMASLEAWIAGGFHGAISGPVSRGDDAIVDGQRHAVADTDPTLLPLFEVLTDATRRFNHPHAAPSPPSTQHTA